MRLVPRQVEKIWGRRDLPPAFGGPVPDGSPPIGEIWFEDPSGADRPLLIKYLFTSEKLSIQVHPDSEAARAAGYPRGKDEAWWILSADEGASIGLGLRHRISSDALREAASDGSLEDLIDWRQAAPGDCIYSPAGTVHALGAGLALIEVQENLDLTYRLYDYGRDRPLQVEEAVEVSKPEPFGEQFEPQPVGDGRVILVASRAFVLERWSEVRGHILPASPNRPAWLIPLAGRGSAGDEPLSEGVVLVIDHEIPISLEAGASMLVAYPGDAPYS